MTKVSTNLIWTDNDAFLQTNYGDVLICDNDYPLIATEIKSEWDNPNNNLYLEDWSNKDRNPGWMFKLTCCDILLYQFLNTKELYGIKFQPLAEWFKLNYTKFKSRQQRKCKQANDTRGRLVPIKFLIEELGMVSIPYYTNGDGVESWQTLLSGLVIKKKQPIQTFDKIYKLSETNITDAVVDGGNK